MPESTPEKTFTEHQVITEAFTELAPDYPTLMDKELRQYWGISYRDFVGQLVQTIPASPGELILDIATGTAVIPLEIQGIYQRQDPIVGLDITPAMLRQARRAIIERSSAHSICLVCASAMAMPFKDGSFNVVVCGLGTHHMNVPQMLAEASRVLVAGGRLIIADVCASPFWRSLWGKILLRILLIQYGLLQRSVRARAEIDAFQNVRTAQEWRKLLLDSGFSKIEMRESKARRPWYPSALTLKAERSTLPDFTG